MISNEIADALSLAAFEPIEREEFPRRVFARGPCTLVINEDATWSCHRQASNSRRLCRFGYTVESLLEYLTYDVEPTAR